MLRLLDVWIAVLATTVGVFGASVYANLSYDVTDGADFASFPPFRPGYDGNYNDHLGAEYYEIAVAITKGRGYADPFRTESGPTAWMPPLLTLYTAGILHLNDGDKTATANALIVSQAVALWLTGLLTLLIARRTAPRVPSVVVAALMTIALITRFHTAFQVTHDSWLVMLAVDALLFGMLFGRVLSRPWRALLWGMVGGLTALVSPIAGLCWGAYSLTTAIRERRVRPLLFACVAMVVVMSPWIVRNYLVFGRFIPVKSNLAYELYQSQLLNEEGRLSTKVFRTHPYSSGGAERAEYVALGEQAFLERKREQFLEAVRHDPKLFLLKIYDRLQAATIDYSPMDDEEYERELLFRLCYLLQPLTVFAAVSLVLASPVRRLPRGAWAGLTFLAVYLLPYVLVSYYDRYEFPIWGLKTLVLVWWLEMLFSGTRPDEHEIEGPAATMRAKPRIPVGRPS